MLGLIAFLFLQQAEAAAPCADQARMVWLLSADDRLWSLQPELLELSSVGVLRCKVESGSRPTAMAMTAQGELWVSHSLGELASVDPQTLDCRVAKARVEGVKALAVEPEEQGDRLVAVVEQDGAGKLFSLDPQTGAMQRELALSQADPLVIDSLGRRWMLSPGQVPELMRVDEAGRTAQRRSLVQLRGEQGLSAFWTVGEEPWLSKVDETVNPRTGLWNLAREERLLRTSEAFVLAASHPRCTAVSKGNCQAKIESPARGEVLFGWKPFEVSVSGNATHVRVDTPNSARLVELRSQGEHRSVQLSLPSSERVSVVRLRPADADGGVCGEESEALRSKLALRITILAPTSCLEGARCEVEVGLEQTGADDVTRSFFESPRLRGHVSVAGSSMELVRDENGHWKGALEKLPAGEHTLLVRFEAVGLSFEDGSKLVVKKEPEIDAPEFVDLGRLQPDTQSRHACSTLDLTTRGLEGVSLRLTARPSRECLGRPYTMIDGVSHPLDKGVDVKTTSTMRLPVCVEVPACGGPESREVPLELRALFDSQERVLAQSKLRWEAVSPGVDCRRPWIVGVFSVFFGGLGLLGFFLPKRFPAQLSIRTAPSRAELESASPRVLRSLRGGRRGWWRDARIGLDEQGRAVRDEDSALVFILSEVVPSIESGASRLRRFNPKTHRLDPIEGVEEIVSGIVYEAGGLWIRFE